MEAIRGHRQPPVVDQVIQREELDHFLSGLPQQERRIVELRLRGLSNAEIARELGIAETTVWRFLKGLLPDESE